MSGRASSPCLTLLQGMVRFSRKLIQSLQIINGTYPPTGSILRFSPTQHSQIEIVSLNDSEKKLIDVKSASLWKLKWAPDNQHLFVQASSGIASEILLFDVSGSSKVLLKKLPGEAVITDVPRPSPNGRYLAYILTKLDANAVMLEDF
jgi:Tol biopolymer transport system component